MVYTLLRELQSDILKEFYKNFENDLSKPQFDHFQAWISGILDGLFEGSKVSKQFSDKHKSSLTRFMNSDTWNHHELNAQRISWASNIMSQQYMKYYPLIIDDTINEKYGTLLDGVGKFFDHGKKRIVWGQQLVTSHLVMANSDLPLFIDLYRKEEEVLAEGLEFRSKIDIAMDHIRKFPKLPHRQGVVVTDSWYSSVKIINLTLERGFHGIFDLKSDRLVTFKKRKISVSQLAAEQDITTFDLVKIDGRMFRVWTAKVKVSRVHQDHSRLIIVQQKLKPRTDKERWSKFKYLLATDTTMGAWLIIYLYRRRWTIETFYRYIKNCFYFGASRLESEEALQKYFTLIYFAYTFLVLTRDPLCQYYTPSKSLYEAQEVITQMNFEEVIRWIYDKTMQGIDLSEIKANFGL